MAAPLQQPTTALRLRSRGSGGAKLVRLEQTRTTVGRSPRATLTIDDPFASRLHAELRHEGDSWWVSDLGSSNGTYLNGNRVTGPVQLFAGDRIAIGETELAFESLDGPATEIAPPPDAGAPEVPSTTSLESLLDSVRRASGEPVEAAPDRDLFAVVSKVGVALLSSSALDEVLTRILELVFDGIPAERAYLFLRDADDRPTKLRAASYRDPHRKIPLEEVRVSRTVERQVVEERQSVLSTDAQVDDRYRDLDSVRLSGVRSIMAVPMVIGERNLGMVYVDSPLEVRPFTRQDLQLLTTIASVAAIKVENAILLEERIESQRLRDEIQKARALQARLLPGEPPEVAGYTLAGVSFPCFEVGGDYFDFVPAEDGRLVITLGDVSGKGLDAALLMSSLHASVRSQVGRGSVGDLIERVNAYLCGAFPYNKFATLFCGVLDPATNELAYANAGHNPPLLMKVDGEVQELGATGLPAGLDRKERYTPHRVTLDPGDVLFAYSDGVSEASGADDEPVETHGLADILRPLRDEPAGAILDGVDAALVDRLGGGDPEDDMTMVVLKRDRG